MIGTENKVICYLTETPKCMKSGGIHITPTFFSLICKVKWEVTPNEYRLPKNFLFSLKKISE